MYRQFLTSLVLATGLAACASSTATGRYGEELTLVQPADQTVRRGETNKVSVYVRRDKLDRPVELKIDGLPQGVEIVEREPRVAAGTNLAELTLYARPDADLVSGHAVKVTASAGDETKAVQWFHVNVKPQ
jgi:hypothetical protein